MRTGDTIAIVAQPVAKGIDWVFGTDWQNCYGCHQMQNNLNAGMGLVDSVIARFWSNKQQTEGTIMKQSYVVIEQTVIEEADSPADAIAQKVAGKGQPVSINAQVRPQPVQRPAVPGGLIPPAKSG